MRGESNSSRFREQKVSLFLTLVILLAQSCIDVDGFYKLSLPFQVLCLFQHVCFAVLKRRMKKLMARC